MAGNPRPFTTRHDGTGVHALVGRKDFSDVLELGGSIRYDAYKASENGKNLDGEHSVSSKLSALLTPFENGSLNGLGFSAVIGKTFRAPAVHEFFGRCGAGEESCSIRRGVKKCSQLFANPDLKGETAKSYELGARYNNESVFNENDDLSFALNYIHNDIEDIIQKNEGIADYVNANGDKVETYQYQNINKAVIKGWEALIKYDSDRWFTSLSYQNLDGYSIKDDGSRKALNYFSPDSLNITAGIYFNDKKGTIGLERFYRGGYNPDGLSARYQRHQYSYYNLFASYNFSDDFSLQFRVNNLTDKLYTTGAIAESNGVDITKYAAGRNFKFTMNYRF